MAAIDPAMWVHDGLLLSESMAIFTSAGLIWFAYRLWRSPSLSRVLWLGAWCGLATLARSELALAVPFLLVPLILSAAGIDWSQRLRWLVVGGLLAALVISPWIAFNRSRFEEPVMLSTNFGRTMAAAKCPGGYSGPFLGAQSYDCLRRDQKLIKPGMDESEVDRVYRSEAIRYVKAHPGGTVVQVAASWGRIFGVYRPTQELGYSYTRQTKGLIVGWLALLSFYLLVVAAIAGAVILRRRKVPIYPLLVFWAMILVSVTLTFAQQRYRAIGEPTLVILTAVALDELARRRSASARSLRSPDGG